MEKLFSSSIENINKEMDQLCKKNKVIGANAVLFSDEEILYSHSYGYINKEAKQKSKSDSLYMIGSNTKVMTALGIFKLFEEKKLSLTDDIRKFIPEFQVKSTFAYDKITIENLLMHRSGLVCDLYHLILDPARDYHEIIEELKNTYLTAIPGEMFAYSNVGYTLLGIVIERVSGLTYPKYIQKVIGEPLGIRIHFLQTAKERKPFSKIISLCYNKKGKVTEDALSTMLPAGSNTYISMNDFVKFGQMFLKKDNRILKKETLELMEKLNVKEQVDNELMNVGYGLIHNQYYYGETVGKVLGHGGNTTCHHSIFNYIPSLNIGVIVFTNSENGIRVSGILGVKLLTKYLKGKGFITGDYQVEHKHIKADCKEYLGKFVTPLGLHHITENKRKELVTKVNKFPVKLIPCEDGFLQCYPGNLLLQLPPFKKMIKGLRFKLIRYFGGEVMILEQTAKNRRNMGIVGCRYKETRIPKSFEESCGSYEIVNVNLMDVVCRCKLCMENGALKLELEALNTKIISYLEVVDDNLAFTQGFGRNAKQAVQIRENNGDIYLTYSGIVFKKKKK